jgi:hypothetical protein
MPNKGAMNPFKNSGGINHKKIDSEPEKNIAPAPNTEISLTADTQISDRSDPDLQPGAYKVPFKENLDGTIELDTGLPPWNGSTRPFYLNEKGIPRIVIGPHWPLFPFVLIFKGLAVGGFLIAFGPHINIFVWLITI